MPASRLILAALGPRKLELARDRAAGAILLLVTPAYVRTARELLGDQATLVLDVMVVLDTDAGRARETARAPLRFLSGVPGYRASFSRMGFADAEVDALSDRLVDELVIWGDPATVTARLGEFRDAGADHIALHIRNDACQPGPLAAARQLAPALFTDHGEYSAMMNWGGRGGQGWPHACLPQRELSAAARGAGRRHRALAGASGRPGPEPY